LSYSCLKKRKGASACALGRLLASSFE
jgi:hypothetical protein